MKNIFLAFVLFSSLCHAQQLKKWIDAGNLAAIQKFELSQGDIHSEITIEVTEQIGTEEELMYYDLHPLVYATGKEQISIVKYYLSKADTYYDAGIWADFVGQAFIIALSRGNEELATLLYESQPDLSAFCGPCNDANAVFVAASYGRENWYFKLAETTDLMVVNSKGATILHGAVNGGSEKIIHDLVENRKLEVNVSDLNGYTLLDYAAADSNYVVFDYLVKHGASLDNARKIWFSAVNGGDHQVWNYIKEHANHSWLFEPNSLLELPLNDALAFNDIELAEEITLLMTQYLDSNPDFVFDTDVFVWADVLPIYWPIYWKSERGYELVMGLYAYMNQTVLVNEPISIDIAYRKLAVKSFGKDYVSMMDAEMGNIWAE